MLRQINDLYCFAFDAPVTLDPALLGPVLPLRAVGQTTLASYDLSHIVPADRGMNRLHVVRHGQPVSYDLYAAMPVDPLVFWDFEGLGFLRSMPLPKPATVPPFTPKPQPQTPRESAVLQEIKQAEPIYGDIRDAVDAAKSYDVMDYVRRGGRALRGLAATLLLICLGMIIAFGSLGVLTLGATSGLFGLFVACCIVYGLWLLFTGSQVIGGKGSNRATSARATNRSAVPPRYRGPGMFDRLKSWALWNTHLGDKLRADLSRHINEVSRMIENGEIDRALKRALALGAEQAAKDNRRNHGPASLPKPRATLDMDLSGLARPTASILNDRSFIQMAAQYRDLAQKLSADGDHRRAAFIYSELLKDIPKALSELERLKAFEDAAKLATARKSPGHITARLWFLAGKKEIALALAKRHDAMEYIANISEKSDPEFAAFVRGHWIKDLITAGDLSGAVMQSAGRPALKTLHIAVTKQAVLAGLLSEAPVLVAATIALDWRPVALNDDFIGTAENSIEILETYLHDLIHGADPVDAPARRALLAGLVEQKPKKQSGTDPFWIERAPLLGDAVIRATLAYDADHPAAAPLAELRRAAKEMNVTVLAEDLRQVVRSKPKTTPQRRSFALPSAALTVQPHWTMIACVGNGHTLVGAKTGELTLLDANGKRRWTDQMTGLVGIVPIGPGRLVILIQADGAEKQLTLLDTALHSYRALGRIALVAWHQNMSAAAWVVQTPQAIGAFDVSVLLDDVPRFDFLWSITQTVPIVVLGFHVGKNRVQWVSQRVNGGAPGLIETWWLSFTNENLNVSIVDPAGEEARLVYQTRHLWTAANQFWPATQAISPQWQPKGRALRLVPYDFAEEQEVMSNNAAFFDTLTDFAQVIGVPEEGACVINSDASGAPRFVMWQQKKQPFAILEGATCAMSSNHSGNRRLALIDDHQRVIICDFDLATVTFGLL
ncbi:hypothetical protein [Yoonia maricola]|nr:hypothetical protein [Yoonia maricola]